MSTEREKEQLRRQLARGRVPEEEEARIRPAPEQNQQFDHKAQIYMGACPSCSSRVAFHCGECNVKLTGCNCTLDTLLDTEIARARREQTGLWTPDER